MTRPGRRWYSLLTGVYTLALGVWVGAMVMLAIGAAVTFRTTRSFNPALPAPYDAPELAGRASQILAGGVVGNMIDALSRVQIVCGVIAMACVILQGTLFRAMLPRHGKSIVNAIRIMSIGVAIAFVPLERLFLNPAIHELRTAMYDASENDQARAAAKREFDYLHKISERTTGAAAALLAVAIILSPLALTPRVDAPDETPAEPHPA